MEDPGIKRKGGISYSRTGRLLYLRKRNLRAQV